jgi:hypothetical protein
MNLTHPSLMSQLKNYQACAKVYYHISDEALTSQLERLKKMQFYCLDELKKPKLVLTACDLFFKMFGGEDLYKIAKQKGYPDLAIFAHLISDPYHASQKDFADHDSIPASTLLEKPRANQRKILFTLKI